MTFRMLWVKSIFRLNRFLADLPVLILRPEQLIQFTKKSYSKTNIVRSWSDPEILKSGLSPEEKKAISHIPLTRGSLLLLGMGGGREAIPLAKMGYEVTGIDFIPEMVRNAVHNAQKQGVDIKGKVLDVSNMRLPKYRYDIVWMSSSGYSGIPSRKKRIRVLKEIKKTLKSGGYLYCEFKYDFHKEFSKGIETIKRIIAFLCLGNLHYEEGDILWANFEFSHRFTSQKSLISEFEEAGLDIFRIDFPENSVKGNAILKVQKTVGHESEKNGTEHHEKS